MCKDEGMAMAPWGALGGGYFKPQDQIHQDGGRNLPAVSTGKEAQVSAVLEKVAKRHDTIITSVALAYVLHKAPYTFPICVSSRIFSSCKRLTNRRVAGRSSISEATSRLLGSS